MPGALRVESDLTFTVAGGGDDGTGSAQGRVSASGSEVRVTTTDAAAVWDAALGSSTTGTQALSFVADRLADGGLTLVVDGPDGEIARVGAGIHSRFGRVATGSSRVRLGGPRALAPLARAQGVPQARARLAAAPPAVLLAVAGVIAGVVVARLLRGLAQGDGQADDRR